MLTMPVILVHENVRPFGNVLSMKMCGRLVILALDERE
jgi:hypothetical protein